VHASVTNILKKMKRILQTVTESVTDYCYTEYTRREAVESIVKL